MMSANFAEEELGVQLALHHHTLLKVGSKRASTSQQKSEGGFNFIRPLSVQRMDSVCQTSSSLTIKLGCDGNGILLKTAIVMKQPVCLSHCICHL